MDTEITVKPRGELTPFQAQLRKDAAEAVPGERAGFPWITIKLSKEFYLAGQKLNAPLEVIFLSAAFDYSWYEGAFDSETRALPDCFAIGRDQNLLAPHVSAPKPQSASCATCPQGEWGSAPNGNGGKACRQRIRLAVVTPDMQQIAFMRIPPTSIAAWSNYVMKLKMHQLPMYAAVARLSFDAKANFPKLVFDFKEFIEDETRVRSIKDMRALVMDALVQPPAQSKDKADGGGSNDGGGAAMSPGPAVQPDDEVPF